MSEVIKKIFASDIQKNIFPDNSFIKRSKLDAGVAIDAKTVEIPQAGTKVSGGKNPTIFPLVPAQREDDKLTYDVDYYYSDPIFVTNENQAIVSYDKRKEILEESINYLEESYADDVAHIWCPTNNSNIIRTTGENKDATMDGATGTRKSATLKDFVNADRVLNRMNAPKKGRCCLMSADEYADILNAGIKGFIGVDKLDVDAIKNGVVGKLLNFEIYVRSSVARYSNDANPQKKAVGAVELATDNDITLFWHPMRVRRAEGVVKVLYNKDVVGYQGDVFNAAVRGGACIPRTDQVGVVALVQAHGV